MGDGSCHRKTVTFRVNAANGITVLLTTSHCRASKTESRVMICPQPLPWLLFAGILRRRLAAVRLLKVGAGGGLNGPEFGGFVNGFLFVSTVVYA